MVWECGPVASGSASRRTAARSSAVEYSSEKASIGARVGCLAAAWPRRYVSALLQAQVAVFWGPAVSGGRRAAGAAVFCARCSRLPLGVSSAGVGGVARASRPRGRRRSKDGRLTVPMAMDRSSDRTSSLGKPALAFVARRRSVTVPKRVRRWRSRNVTTLPTGNCCPGKRVSIGSRRARIGPIPSTGPSRVVQREPTPTATLCLPITRSEPARLPSVPYTSMSSGHRDNVLDSVAPPRENRRHP